MADAGKRLSERDVAELSSQVAGLTGAGLPLGPGLRALGEEMASGRLQRVLDDLAGKLDAGEPLASAIAAPGLRLPAHLKGLVLAGARTGRMGQMLGRFAGFVDVGDDLRRTLWLRLAYPVLMSAAAAVLFVFVCVAVLSPFDLIFSDFGISIPAATVVLMRIARVVTASWWPMLQGILALLLLGLVLGLVVGKPNRRAIASHLPVIGPVWRWTSLAEFCHLLGLLLESELPLGEALSLTGEGVQDAEIRAACRAMTADTAKGKSLSQALAGRRVFPQGMTRIVGWAEGHRGLPDALNMLGEMFEARARSQASFASTVVSIFAVVFILSGIFLTIGAVMIPMIMLISKLSG